MTGEDERLDGLGRALVRLAAMPDAEADRIASSLPYHQLRARLNAERERREALGPWLDILTIGRRIVPAMLAVVVALTGWLWLGGRWSAPSLTTRDIRFEDEPLTGVGMLSEDDVLALLINEPVADAPGREN